MKTLEERLVEILDRSPPDGIEFSTVVTELLKGGYRRQDNKVPEAAWQALNRLVARGVFVRREEDNIRRYILISSNV